MSAHAILYSFRRCPYAMRARLAMAYHNRRAILREVTLRDKPSHMLDISPKGTVPVLQTPDGEVIEESLDIMRWAMGEHTALLTCQPEAQLALIARHDQEFKRALDHYKYHVRYPERSMEHHRAHALEFIAELEQMLAQKAYLCGASPQLADLAIMPFVRQFAMVDRAWFFAHPDYPHTQRWLNAWLESDLFTCIMVRYEPWQPGDAHTFFLDAHAPLIC